MNTKNAISLASLMLSLSLVACGDPEQKFRVTVVDESGTPMKGIEVAAWFNRKGGNSPLDSYKVTGPTDAGGMVELKGETVWYPRQILPFRPIVQDPENPFNRLSLVTPRTPALGPGRSVGK